VRNERSLRNKTNQNVKTTQMPIRPSSKFQRTLTLRSLVFHDHCHNFTPTLAIYIRNRLNRGWRVLVRDSIYIMSSAPDIDAMEPGRRDTPT